MASTTNTSNGQFVWHEHLAKDPKAAIRFYTEAVGWKTEPFGQGDGYTMWVGAQGPLGGVAELPVGAPPHWLGSVQVNDVDATCKQAKELGGRILKEAAEIPEVGRFAVIADPQGATVEIFTPSRPMTAHDKSKDGEFCWNELLTSDSGAAYGFYSKLFGWKTLEEMDMGAMGTYRIFGVGDTRLGGMMTTPKGNPMPPSWIFYASTSDLDASVKRATHGGAKVVSGPLDVPGGRIVQMTDPQGATFAFHQAKPETRPS